MKKNLVLLTLMVLFISSLAAFACPNEVKTYKVETTETQQLDESGISPWHFATPGFIL